MNVDNPADIEHSNMSSTDTNDKIQMWEDYVEDVRLAHRIPGIAVGMVCGSELAWFKGFGETRMGNGEAPDEHRFSELRRTPRR